VANKKRKGEVRKGLSSHPDLKAEGHRGKVLTKGVERWEIDHEEKTNRDTNFWEKVNVYCGGEGREESGRREESD